MPSYEDEILARYSTPGLRKRELDRWAKRDHLGSLGVKGEDAGKILDQMYGALPDDERKAP